jgi:hypothetical protein
MGALSWTDHCEDDIDGTPGLVVSGGTASYDAAYPGANMLTNDPSLVAQIDLVGSGAGILKVRPVWSISSNSQTVRVLAALNVRIPSGIPGLAVTARALAGGGAGSPAVQASATLAYGASDMCLIEGTTDRYNLFFYFASDTTCGGVSLEFSYSSSPGTIYIEIGRIWAGPALVLDTGAQFDWEPIDPSIVERGPSGGFSSQRLPTRKAIRMQWPAETYANALGTAGSTTALSLRHALMEAGMGAPVVYMGRTDSLHYLQTTSLFGLITEMPQIRHVGNNRWTSGGRIEQVR